MRKRISRLISVIMILTLMLVVFSACGNSSSSSESTVTNNSDNSTQSSNTEDSNANEAPLELTALMVQYSQPPDPESDLWKTIEDAVNVHYTSIDWVPYDNYTDKLNMVINSGDLPDIVYTINVSDPTILKAVKGGLFADLGPVLGDFSNYPNLANVNPDAWNTSKVDGKNYLFPRSRGNYDMPIAMLRGDWLDKLNMDIPTTLDEYAVYLKAVTTQDLDGNGNIDTIGATNLGMTWMPSAFGSGNKLIARPDGKDTGIVNVRFTESYAKALEYWQSLYAQGCVDTEYAMLGSQQQEDLFVSGKSATFTKNIWHRKRMDNELQGKVDPNAYAALMFALEGPGGKAFHYDKGYAGGLLVSSKVSQDKLKQIVSFMDRSADPDNYNLICFGVEGTYYTMQDGFPVLTELGQKEIFNSLQYPFCLATNTFQKVDSPLADAAYNKATRKMTTDALDPVFAEYKNPLNLDILQSVSWATFWSQKQDEFEAFEADVVSGKKSVDDFRAYQQGLLKDPLVVKSFDEFQDSYDGFGLPQQ